MKGRENVCGKAGHDNEARGFQNPVRSAGGRSGYIYRENEEIKKTRVREQLPAPKGVVGCLLPRHERRLAMNGRHERQNMGIGWIILLVLLYIIFNPIPGPIDDAAVAAIGGYQALKRL
jgi:hypothetical protein